VLKSIRRIITHSFGRNPVSGGRPARERRRMIIVS
jgi:hypothetical protein